MTGPTTYTAKGGLGGTHAGPFATPWQYNPTAENTTTGGDASQSGGIGTPGYTVGTANGNGGWGGSSKYSAGAPALTGLTGTGTSAAGTAADGFGGGGSGAIGTGAGAAAAGGNGSAGTIIIYEYS